MDFGKERDEALSAGRAALASLERARSMLSSARGWGIYDTFFKGGLISGMVKHSKMRKAEECIGEAKRDLVRFDSELRDLDLMGIDLKTGDLIGMADILFDSFLSDILMQSRIKDACRQVDAAIERVRELVSRIERLPRR